MTDQRIHDSLDKLHDKVDALRNDWSSDRLTQTERLAKLEGQHNNLAGRVKIYVSIAIGALSLGAAMLFDWAKARLGL